MRYGDDHRPILCRLVDDPDFQALSGDAQRLWFFLRVSPECGPVGLFRFYASTHQERLRMTPETFSTAIEELESGRWVIREGGYILLRNAMHFEPSFKPARDPKHLACLHSALAGLAHLQIAHYLLASEGLPEPKEWSKKALQRPLEGPRESFPSLPFPFPSLPSTENQGAAAPERAVSKSKRFTPPTAAEVQSHLDALGERRFSGDEFVTAYEARGWMLGKTPMKNWRMAIKTWRDRRDREDGNGGSRPEPPKPTQLSRRELVIIECRKHDDPRTQEFLEAAIADPLIAVDFMAWLETHHD